MATTKQAKAAYQKKYNATPKAKKKRAADNKARKDLGLKKGDKRDASRKGGGFVAEDRSANRSRGGKKGNRAGKAAGGRKSSRKGVKNKR